MKSLFHIFIFLLLSVSGFSQSVQERQASAHFEHARKVWVNASSPSHKHIVFAEGTRIDGESGLRRILQIPERSGLKMKTRFTDRIGISHTRYQICYDNIPLEGAFLITHQRGDRLISANGDLHTIAAFDTKPEVPLTQARLIASENIGAREYYPVSAASGIESPELVILPLDNQLFLAYRFDIYAKEPFSRHYVYVDAKTGDVLKKSDRIHASQHAGQALTKYHGIQSISTEQEGDHFILNDHSRNAHISTLDMNTGTDYLKAIHFVDDDNYWDIVDNQDDAATNAHFAVQQTYDYFKLTFGRNSFDDQGADIISYIHFGDAYENAFWSGNSFVYGDGNGYSSMALTPLDVVAHEYTHAVTQYSAGLEYAFESGALNESFSDIFAVSVDFHTNPASANYLLGEQFSLQGTPSRNMADPKQCGHPDTYKGEFWYTGTADNGGVHTNSSVQNYWFYLLAEGGEGMNDLGNAYSVDGMGIEKAAAIAYRNLTVYLTPYSDFEDARFYAIQSAVDLFGACSPEVAAVTDAWYAVGVGEAFSGEVRAQFETSANYAREIPADVIFTNTSRNAAGYLWSFGDGSTSNEENPVHTYQQAGEYTVRLIAYGENGCQGTDTLILGDLLTIHPGDPELPETCFPGISEPDITGISAFIFKDIRNFSGLSDTEGAWADHTGNFFTRLSSGERVDFKVTTGPKYAANISLWIDANNNGAFESDEKLWESFGTTGEQEGSLIIPEVEALNEPLRMRIISDRSGFGDGQVCGTLYSGQAEDYRIIIQHTDNPPVADFIVQDSIVGAGETISIQDFSQFNPGIWRWELPGAEPSASLAQHPELTYPDPGIYPVSLYVENEYGQDSLTKTQCIEVLPAVIMGTAETSREASGLLYDSGNKDGNYADNENTGFLIQPSCARTIKINFLSFELEEGTDHLYVYDGTDAQGELLLKASGNHLPDEVVAQSGSVYLVFTSNLINTDAGFILKWEAGFPPRVPVEADFIVDDHQPALMQKIQFEDVSTSDPSEWIWDFGDGYLSAEKNPQHYYETPGVKEIRLYSSNCFFADTALKTIYVLPSPQIQVGHDTIRLSVVEGQAENLELNIANLDEEGELICNFLIRDIEDMVYLQKAEIQNTAIPVGKEADTISGSTLLGNLSTFYPSMTFASEFSYSQVPLSTVLGRFSSHSDQLYTLIPDAFQFDGGTSGNSIQDGGKDMYDGGNYLSTDLENWLAYTGDIILSSAGFGPSGRYFTTRQPGIFFLAADMDQVDEFAVSGNLGADGKGEVDAGIIQIDKGIQSYTGFVKRVYSTSDPSVNHLLIVPNAGQGTAHSIDPNTNSDGHLISGLSGTNRIYYLLFASDNGGYVSDSVMVEIMHSFISMIEPGCDWLQADDKRLSVDPRSSSVIDLNVNAAGLSPGTYTSEIHIISNDMSRNELIIPVYLEVEEACQIEYAYPEYLGETIVGTTLTDTSWVINHGPDIFAVTDISITGDPFTAVLEKSFVNPHDSARLILTYSPSEPGQDTAVISIQSNSNITGPLVHSIYARAVMPPVPLVITEPSDMILYLEGDPSAVVLDSVFTDSMGNELEYAVYCSDNQLMDFYITNGTLYLIGLTPGSGSLEITASNAWGETNRVEFMVTVLGATDLDDEHGTPAYKLYPNPATDYLLLEISGSGDPKLRLRIMDQSGRILCTDQYNESSFNNTIQLDLSQLSPGVYFLLIESGKHPQIIRFIKR